MAAADRKVVAPIPFENLWDIRRCTRGHAIHTVPPRRSDPVIAGVSSHREVSKHRFRVDIACVEHQAFREATPELNVKGVVTAVTAISDEIHVVQVWVNVKEVAR